MRKIDIQKAQRRSNQKGKMPALKWLPIKSLRIDDAYQRPILTRGWKQIEWIAGNFTWASFSPVLVSEIDNGLFALIDGQHRTHAAYMAGHDEVPALCVDASQAEQALAFSSVNVRVTKITPHSIFKAALLAEEKWAVDSDRAVTDAGCRLMRSNASQKNKKPGQVFSVFLIRDMVNNLEGEAVTTGLRAIRDSHIGQDVDAWSVNILRPWLKSIASNSAYLHIDLKAALDKNVDLFLFDEQAARKAKENKEPKSRVLIRMICSALDDFRKGPGQ